MLFGDVQFLLGATLAPKGHGLSLKNIRKSREKGFLYKCGIWMSVVLGNESRLVQIFGV